MPPPSFGYQSKIGNNIWTTADCWYPEAELSYSIIHDKVQCQTGSWNPFYYPICTSLYGRWTLPPGAFSRTFEIDE